MPTALEYLYTTRADIDALLSSDGVDLRLDDNAGGSVSATELAYLTTQGINYATDRVNNYLMGRYAPVNLYASWTVADWTTILAARWLCSRRGNDVPKSLERMYKETVEEMEEVRTGAMALAAIEEYVINAPAWSNVRVTPHSRMKRLRVERPLSERTAPGFSRRNVDYYADVLDNER